MATNLSPKIRLRFEEPAVKRRLGCEFYAERSIARRICATSSAQAIVPTKPGRPGRRAWLSGPGSPSGSGSPGQPVKRFFGWIVQPGRTGQPLIGRR